MKPIKNLLLSLTLIISAFCNAQFTDEVNSNRPGKSHMAFAVGKSLFQTESGLNYVTEDHSKLKYNAKGINVDFAMRWGLLKEELEINAELQYQKDNYDQLGFTKSRSALRQTILGVKYLFLDPFKNYVEKPNLYSWKAQHRFKWRQLLPAIAGYAGVNFNFSDGNLFYNTTDVEPIVNPKIMVIAQNHFGSRWVLVTNLGYNKIGSEFASIDYILTLTRGLNKNWSAFVENQGYNGKYYNDAVFRLGAAYLHKKDMQFDASIGTNVKNTPSLFYGGIGFTWRFTKNYKPIKLAEPGTQSKMDKKIEKAEKKKKRKDGIE